jgi:hypothetical protein
MLPAFVPSAARLGPETQRRVPIMGHRLIGGFARQSFKFRCRSLEFVDFASEEFPARDFVPVRLAGDLGKGEAERAGSFA